MGAFILSDVIEGVGAIHTQAFWSPANQQNAHARMLAPGDFRLDPNYPNPFNPETVISYQLSVVSDVFLNIYNLLGEKIITLVAKRQPAGIYRVSWDGRDEGGRLMPSGVYFAQLRVNGDVRTVRMVLAR